MFILATIILAAYEYGAVISNAKSMEAARICVSMPGNIWRKVYGKITKKPTNFSWVIDQRLAGSGMPTSFNEFGWALEQGVKAIVTMTENPLPDKWVSSIGYLHVPTPDLTAPDMDRIDVAVDFIHEQINGGKPVMVHCAAGMGRAGTILACYMVKYRGYLAGQAIKEIRDKRPGSIQSQVQELAVGFYERHIGRT